MNKYVNGKLIKMTEEDINKRNSRIANRPNLRKDTSKYEAKVKELEDTVAMLVAKLAEAEK